MRVFFLFGAGDGNRTHAICLGSKSSTIELHPRCFFGNQSNTLIMVSKNYELNFFYLCKSQLIFRAFDYTQNQSNFLAAGKKLSERSGLNVYVTSHSSDWTLR